MLPNSTKRHISDSLRTKNGHDVSDILSTPLGSHARVYWSKKDEWEVHILYCKLIVKISPQYYHLYMDQPSLAFQWWSSLSTRIVTICPTISFHMEITLQSYLLYNSKAFLQFPVTLVHGLSPPGILQNRDMLFKIWQLPPASLRKAVKVQSWFALLLSSRTAWAILTALPCTFIISTQSTSEILFATVCTTEYNSFVSRGGFNCTQRRIRLAGVFGLRFVDSFMA